jgi:hypothetical protein
VAARRQQLRQQREASGVGVRDEREHRRIGGGNMVGGGHRHFVPRVRRQRALPIEPSPGHVVGWIGPDVHHAATLRLPIGQPQRVVERMRVAGEFDRRTRGFGREAHESWR